MPQITNLAVNESSFDQYEQGDPQPLMNEVAAHLAAIEPTFQGIPKIEVIHVERDMSQDSPCIPSPEGQVFVKVTYERHGGSTT